MERTDPLSERFANTATESIYNGEATKKARKTLPEQYWNVARRKLTTVLTAVSLADTNVPPTNRLHALKLDRKGQHAIRIEGQYRVCFKWTAEGATEVEVTDYH